MYYTYIYIHMYNDMVVEYLGTLEGILYDNTRLLFLEAIGGNDSYHG